MKINPINFNLIQNKPQKAVNRTMFKNNGLQTDVFCFTGNSSKETPTEKMEKLVPKHKGTIYKKVKDKNGNMKKVPTEVYIFKSNPNTFDFVRGGKNIGYARLNYIPAELCEDECVHFYDELSTNYRDLGIVGDRIEVDFVKNEYEDKYGGIGHLADLLEVACCKELGFAPNVISISVDEAAPLHYKRGKRFVPYERYCSDIELAYLDLGGKNPNDTMKEIIENTPKGEKFDTSEIKLEPLMYMPKEMIKELEEELKEHPIF